MTFYNFYNPSLHSNTVRGTFTSVLDAFNLIKEHIDCNIVNTTTEVGNLCMLLQKNKNFNTNFKISKFEPITDDTIIMSSRVLIDSIKENIKLKCKTLVLLDSADICLGNLGIGPDIGSILKNNPKIKFDKLILLANPSNKEVNFEKYEYIEHYHKFNINRLTYLKEPFKYSRSDKEWIKAYNFYLENIGKGLIERLILNIPVHYSPKGKGFDDGLHYYLKYLGIDDNIEQDLKEIDIKKLTTIKKDLAIFKGII